MFLKNKRRNGFFDLSHKKKSQRKPKKEINNKADLNVEIKSDGTVKIAPNSNNASPNPTTP